MASVTRGDVFDVRVGSGCSSPHVSLQLRLNVAGPFLVDSDEVSWDDSLLEDLPWWSVESHLLAGLPLGLPQPDLYLFTEASGSGVVTLSICLLAAMLLATPGSLCPSRYDASSPTVSASLLSSTFDHRELQKPYTREPMVG